MITANVQHQEKGTLINTKIVVTHKAGTRIWTQAMLNYAKQAENAELGKVNRHQLLELAKDLSFLNLCRSAIDLLIAIIKTAPPEQFLGQGPAPIVYKKNITFADELNMHPKSIARLLTKLVQAGFVVMHDSENRHRRPAMADKNACGVDLRILVARYDALRQQINEIRQAKAERNRALRTYKNIKAKFSALHKDISKRPNAQLLLKRAEEIFTLLNQINDLKTAKIQQATRLLGVILNKLGHTIRLPLGNQTVTHKENINKQVSKRTVFFQKFEKTFFPPPETNSTPFITELTLDRALKHVKQFLKLKQCTFELLKENTARISTQLNLHSSVIAYGNKVLGRNYTTIIMAYVFERVLRKQIQSVKGYYLSLIQRGKQGLLDLVASFKKFAQPSDQSFPSSGSVAYSKWEKIARENLPKPQRCIDLVAHEFRNWCERKGIGLRQNNIEQIFKTFCVRQHSAHEQLVLSKKIVPAKTEKPPVLTPKEQLELLITQLKKITNLPFLRSSIAHYRNHGYNISSTLEKELLDHCKRGANL